MVDLVEIEAVPVINGAYIGKIHLEHILSFRRINIRYGHYVTCSIGVNTIKRYIQRSIGIYRISTGGRSDNKLFQTTAITIYIHGRNGQTRQ